MEQAKFTPEQVAELKAMAEDAMWGWSRRLAWRLAISPELVFSLCEDLEQAQAERENRLANPTQTPALRRAQVEITTLREVLKECVGAWLDDADLTGKRVNDAMLIARSLIT